MRVRKAVWRLALCAIPGERTMGRWGSGHVTFVALAPSIRGGTHSGSGAVWGFILPTLTPLSRHVDPTPLRPRCTRGVVSLRRCAA